MNRQLKTGYAPTIEGVDESAHDNIRSKQNPRYQLGPIWRPDRAGLRRGFTLVQVLLVVSLLAILSGLLWSALGRSRETARRAQCDVRVKAVLLALDAYRQEAGHFPLNLSELRLKKYVTDFELLHCPADPRQSGSYEDFYIIREPRDSGELPQVVCPFHGMPTGIQGFKGRYTMHFRVQLARLTGAADATVQHPGKEPIAAASGMELRGGDRVRTGSGGRAIIQFSDGSTVTLRSNTDVTVLQSFLQGNVQPPLFNIVRQTLGSILCRVQSGSKFDVTTPVATAGALGTVFEVDVDRAGNTDLLVIEGQVALTTVEMTESAPNGRKIRANDRSRSKKRKPR